MLEIELNASCNRIVNMKEEKIGQIISEYDAMCSRIIEIEKVLHLRMDSLKKELDILEERFHSFTEQQAYVSQLIKQKIEK